MFRSQHPSEEAEPPPTFREQSEMALARPANPSVPPGPDRAAPAMTLLGLIFKEAGPKRHRLVLAASLVGLTNSLILMLVN